MVTQHAAPEAPAESRYLKVKDVAAELNIGVRTAYELVEAGIIATVRVGSGKGTMRVTREELDRYERSIGARP